MKFKEYLKNKQIEFDNLTEELKIVKKNWDFDIPGYTIELNDKIKHSLLQRSQIRTSAPLNTIKKDIQKGLSYLANKVQDGTIKNRDMNSLVFPKSDMKLLVLVNPDEHYMRVSTIMNPDMPTKKDTKWTLEEFNKHFWEVKANLLETFAFDSDIDDDIDINGITFLIEPALFENSHEVFQQIDIQEFIIN